MVPTIGYWNIRFLVEPIVLTLKQTNQLYQLKKYKVGDAPNYDKSDWLNEKDNLGLEYPNLPYYIDGEIKLTQTLAILRYLGRKYDLGPKGEEETIRSDVIEQGVMEIMLKLISAWYVASDEIYMENLPKCFDYLGQKLEHTSKVLGSNQFLLGDRITYIDFLLYSTLDYIRMFSFPLFEPYQNLNDYLLRIETLPNIEPYFKDENFDRWTISSPRAKFGNKKP